MAFHRFIGASLTALALAGCVSPTPDTAAGDGQNRHVTIVNNSGFGITHFYGSNTGVDNWQEDILGTSVLANGSSADINFNDGSGYCTFDFKMVFSDGTEGVRNNIDVCKIGTYTINP